MTDDEARKLATRIIDTWPSAAKAYVWRDELINLDPTHAATAYRRCARTAHRPPTPADFLDAYDTARQDARTNNPPQPERCQLCNATGWIDAPPTDAHHPTTCQGTPGLERGDGGCWCHAVKPCRCTTGQTMTAVHARILDTNNTHTR